MKSRKSALQGMVSFLLGHGSPPDIRVVVRGNLWVILLAATGVGLVGLGKLLWASEPFPKDTRAYELVLRTVQRDRQLQARRKAWDYELCIDHKRLDPQGKVLSEWKECQLVSQDRRPDYGTRQGAISPSHDSKGESPFQLSRVIDHFSYQLAGTDHIHGVPCYRIVYFPKREVVARNREEKVLHHVHGTLWVAQEDGTLMKNEGELQEPVSIAWILVTVREFRFTFDTQRLPNGDFGPREIRYRYWISFPFFHYREEIVRKISHFRRAKTSLPDPEAGCACGHPIEAQRTQKSSVWEKNAPSLPPCG